MESIRSMFSFNWLSANFLTSGWSFFLQQEWTGLVVLCGAAMVMDIMSGNSTTMLAAHVAFIVLLRRVLAGGICTSAKRLDGKTVVVTGCNVGIGKETVRDLSKRGARVIMACRDTKTAEKVAKEIGDETCGKLDVLKLDLASLASVRSFVDQLKVMVTEVDILINNAGVMFCPYMKTEDGFEMQMGTNHLGHFLLTNLMLPLLTRAPQARVVTLSSLAHARGVIRFEDMNYENGYDRFKAYGNSKVANILFTRHLAKKLKGTNVKVFSVHPGGVQSNLGRHMPIAAVMSSWFSTLLLKSTREGAQTSLYCALEAEQDDGTYYFSDCAPNYASSVARDDAVAEKLWQVSEEMVGL